MFDRRMSPVTKRVSNLAISARTSALVDSFTRFRDLCDVVYVETTWGSLHHVQELDVHGGLEGLELNLFAL